MQMACRALGRIVLICLSGTLRLENFLLEWMVSEVGNFQRVSRVKGERGEIERKWSKETVHEETVEGNKKENKKRGEVSKCLGE